MTAIYTLTGNLLAERTLSFSAWRVGATQRAGSESFQVGGKGINVSKMLHRLGVPTVAVAFAGGATGEECRAWLAQQAAYRQHLVATHTPTRSGLVVRAPGQPETTFLAPDRVPDETALAECAAFLHALPAGALLALCGSFPGWSSAAAAPVRAALASLAAQQRLVADTYGPPLADLVQQPLRLVKINRGEFDALWPERERDIPVPRRLQLALTRWPVGAWIVTDGPGPVCFASPAEAGEQIPPPVEEVSATGSGDVLFAAVLAKWFSPSRTLGEAVSFALPLAARNAASPGVAEFPFPL